MTKMKQIIALMLTLMIVLTGSIFVDAKDITDVISKVQTLGIMVGTDKGFEPNKTLTRAEATAIIIRMNGYTDEDIAKFGDKTSFEDVASNHWAAKYINAAATLDLVKGVGDNLFAPDTTVTIAEVVTMAVRALGADSYVTPLGT